MDVINLSTLEAQPPWKRENTRCMKPSSVAQTGPSSEADTVGGEIRYQLVHPFAIVKIINSLGCKVVVPLFYAGKLPENFNIS